MSSWALTAQQLKRRAVIREQFRPHGAYYDLDFMPPPPLSTSQSSSTAGTKSGKASASNMPTSNWRSLSKLDTASKGPSRVRTLVPSGYAEQRECLGTPSIGEPDGTCVHASASSNLTAHTDMDRDTNTTPRTGGPATITRAMHRHNRRARAAAARRAPTLNLHTPAQDAIPPRRGSLSMRGNARPNGAPSSCHFAPRLPFRPQIATRRTGPNPPPLMMPLPVLPINLLLPPLPTTPLLVPSANEAKGNISPASHLSRNFELVPPFVPVDVPVPSNAVTQNSKEATQLPGSAGSPVPTQPTTLHRTTAGPPGTRDPESYSSMYYRKRAHRVSFTKRTADVAPLNSPRTCHACP